MPKHRPVTDATTAELQLALDGTPERHYSTVCTPIRGGDGPIEGMQCEVTDDTERIIATRRLRLMMELTTKLLSAASANEVFQAAVTTFTNHDQDIRWAAGYLCPGPAGPASLCGLFGLARDDDACWPATAAAAAGTPQVIELPDGLLERLGYSGDPRPIQAFVVPERAQPGARFVIVAGLNPLFSFDANYREFLSHVAGQIGTALARSQAQAEVLEVNRRLSEVLDSTGEGYQTVDREWRYTFQNRTATQRLDPPGGDRMALNMWAVSPELLGTPFEEAARRTMRDRIATAVEYKYPSPRGMWLETRCYPTADGLTMVTSYIGDRKEAQQMLLVRARQQGALARLGQIALHSDAIPALMAQTARCVGETLENRHSVICTIDPTNGLLVLSASYSIGGAMVGPVTMASALESQCRYVLQSAEPIIMTDAATETRFTPPGHSLGNPASGMSVRIIGADGRPWGVLSTYSDERRDYTNEDALFLQAISYIFASAVHRQATMAALKAERDLLEVRVSNRTAELKFANEGLRRLSGRLMNAQEMERRHTARELHDHIGQSLTLVQLHLGQVEKAVAGLPSASSLSTATGVLNELLDQVRNLSLDLRPSILDDFGLAIALRWYARRFAAASRIEVEMAIDELPARLPAELETACFRVAQEALTNVARHAHASRVGVALAKDPDAVVLQISDDGVGFNSDFLLEQVVGERLGLLGMRERTSMFGGSLEFGRRHTGGTVVTAKFLLPIEREGGEVGQKFTRSAKIRAS